MQRRTEDLESELKASSEQISDLKKDLVATRNEANTDVLTGLANRKYFDSRPSTALAANA